MMNGTVWRPYLSQLLSKLLIWLIIAHAFEGPPLLSAQIAVMVDPAVIARVVTAFTVVSAV